MAAVAHDCLGIALADQHADGTRRAALIAECSGSRGQNIDEVFFAFCLNGHILCRGDDRAAANLGIGLIPGNRCREGAACGGAIACCRFHGGGNKNQVGNILSEDTDAAVFRGEHHAIANGGIDLISGEDHIQRTADGASAFDSSADNTGHCHGKNIVLCFGTDTDILAGGNSGAVAHAGVYTASVVKAGNVHAHACRGGGSQRAADDAAVHAALRLNRSLSAIQHDGCVIVNLRAGFVFREEHGERARHRSLGIQAGRRDCSGNGFHIVVYGCQIVQRVYGAHNSLGAEIHLKAVVLLIAVGIFLTVADVQVDESLVVGAGLIHAAIRNGEKIFKIEGELVVVLSNRLLFGLDLQALCGDTCVLADLCQIFIFVIDQGKGCADTHGGAARTERISSDRDFGLFHSLDHHIAAVYHGAVQDLGAALSVSLHYGNGTRKTPGLALAAHGSRQGLGCQKARKPVVQILSENGVGRNTLRGVDCAGELNIGLIVVGADCHAHRDNIGVDQGVHGSRNACSGSVGAVVCAVFSPGIHDLCGEVAFDLRLCLVGSDIDTHSRRNIHGVVGEAGHILSRITGIGQSAAYRITARSGIARQVQVQRAQHHGHQRTLGHTGGHLTIGARGDAVELIHDLHIGAASGRIIGGVCETHNHSDFFEVAVKARAVGQSEGLSLVLVQSFRINNNRP